MEARSRNASLRGSFRELRYATRLTPSPIIIVDGFFGCLMKKQIALVLAFLTVALFSPYVNVLAQSGHMQQEDDNKNEQCKDGSCGPQNGGCSNGSCGAGGGCSSGNCGSKGSAGGGGARGGGGGALGGMLKKAAPMALPLLMALFMSGGKKQDQPPANLVPTPTPTPQGTPAATPSPVPTVCPSPTPTPAATCDPFGPVIWPTDHPGTLPTPASYSNTDSRGFFPGVDFRKM